MTERITYSFIVDKNPGFSHQAWCLAMSIRRHCGARPEDINIQVTPDVTQEIADVFRSAGYQVKALQPFGDRKWCNKIGQLPNMDLESYDRVILLDTDMIVVADFRPFLEGSAVQAKAVDFPNPSVDVLKTIFSQHGISDLPTMKVDGSDGETVSGNCNGGFYSIPAGLAEIFHQEWRNWALWLMENNGILVREGKTQHIDQIAAAMAFHLGRVPFSLLPSNLNYYVHCPGGHRYHDDTMPVCLIHYHDISLNAAGRIQPPRHLTPAEETAVSLANSQIETDHHPWLLSLGYDA